MAKSKSIFMCTECGHETSKWLGKCPGCGCFNTFTEATIYQNKNQRTSASTAQKALPLHEVTWQKDERISTQIGELDRVLSGGIVTGSLILLGGDPGIGKSTLLLQICQNIGEKGVSILYVSGEESVQQIKMRADRLNITTEKLLLLSETNLNVIEAAIQETDPALIVVDSIQTIFKEEITSAPGSVTQVRECTGNLMRIAKGLNIAIIIVGHVTKDGAIAGPRILEHMVDTVLYFEGERQASYRILRAVKNRFGATNEIGVFEMQEKGLVEIKNPSEYMLSGRPLNVSGSVITCNIEGTRPLLVEVQALVSQSNFGQARRMASGMDFNRIVMLIAVLEKRLKFMLGNFDSYVNIAGGIKVAEPSLDAAAICAIASSYKNKMADPYTIVFGEVGLTGEIRAVTMAEKRAAEALKMGFKQCVMPLSNAKSIKMQNIKIYGVSNVVELLEAVLM